MAGAARIQSSGEATIAFAAAGNVVTIFGAPANGAWDFFIDNIRFEAVPEPSSLALAAVGVAGAAGWGAARRRRRAVA